MTDPISFGQKKIEPELPPAKSEEDLGSVHSYSILIPDFGDSSDLQRTSSRVSKASENVFSSDIESSGESSNDSMMSGIQSTVSIASQQFSLDKSELSESGRTSGSSEKKQKKSVEKKGETYAVLGKGASKIVLEKVGVESEVSRVYFVANGALKTSELRTEVQTVQRVKAAIEFPLIAEEVKKRYEKNEAVYGESREFIDKALESLSSVYTLNKLGVLYEKTPKQAEKEIMQSIHCDQTNAKLVLQLLGHSSYLLEGEKEYDIETLRVQAEEKQSHLAIDLEELPETALGEYAVSSSRAFSDLETFMKNEELSFEDRASICEQVKQAVTQLHAVGFIHGDLKPDNFLIYKSVTGKYIVKLADFGKTRPLSPGQELPRWGNPRYVGPENKSSMAGEVYAVALICIRVMEEPFLNEGESLMEPTSQVSPNLQAKKSRKGIERFLLNSVTAGQIETKSLVGKTLRIIQMAFPKSNPVKIEKEVYRYLQELTAKFVEKEELTQSPKEKKGISSCVELLPFLHEALHSNPSERPRL